MANRRGKSETVADFIFLVSKITANGDCSHEIKRHLLLGRKAMANLGSIIKSTAIHSSILAWRIPWTHGPQGHKKSDTTEAAEHTHSHRCFFKAVPTFVFKVFCEI